MVITDKAVREYRTGHNRIVEHMAANGDYKAYIEGVGHFENCINSTKRALRLLNQLSNHRDGPKLDRTARRAAEFWSDKVGKIRNAIEHIDKDIMSDAGLPEGSAHLLTISSDGSQLEIGSYHLKFVALAQTLQSLFIAGMAIIQALPTPSATTDALPFHRSAFGSPTRRSSILWPMSPAG